MVRPAERVRGGEEPDDARPVGQVGGVLLPVGPGERARLAVEELVRGGHVHLGGGLLLLALLLAAARRTRRFPFLLLLPVVAVVPRSGGGVAAGLEEEKLLLAVAVGAAAAEQVAQAPEPARLPRGRALGELARGRPRRGPRRPGAVGLGRGRRAVGAAGDRVRRQDAAVREQVVGRREARVVAALGSGERRREGELEPRVVVVAGARTVVVGRLVVRRHHGAVPEAEDGVEARHFCLSRRWG
jgi:hypothetical protein